MRAVFAPIFVLGFSLTPPANAQVDLNRQTTFDTFAPSIAKSIDARPLSTGVCDITKDQFVAIVHNPAYRRAYPKLKSFAKETRELTAESFSDPVVRERFRLFAIPILQLDLCKTRQPTTVKVSAALNPSFETNVLKSPSDIHYDRAFGISPNLLITTGGFRDFDVVGLSVGTASARYDRFGSKSFDLLSTQAIYQFFAGAFAYGKDGVPFHIDERTDKLAIPSSPNVITVDTLAIALQNQTAYTPTFNTRTSDLLTPQVQYTRSNMSLLGSDKSNLCSSSDAKPGFCYYVDAFINLGYTFSDKHQLENTNISESLTVGRRIDRSDWKIAVQTMLTERVYDNGARDRRDLLFQTGPSVSYSRPAMDTPLGTANVLFGIPVTYYNNYSTLEAAEWHGWVVMPTLTLAFVPK